MYAVRRFARDQGETLLELVIAITILGTCVVAIGAGIVGTVTISNIHRQQADASKVLHNYAEALEGTTYSPCPGAMYSLPTVSGFSSPTITISYWNKSLTPTAGFQPTCPGTDQGVQRVKIDLANSDGRVSESLTVVLRNTS
jgi:hypothetical protein